MAKAYQVFFEQDDADKIEKIATDAGLRSGRQWIIEQVFKAIKKYEEAMKAFDMPEFVFLMKDGSYKQGRGVNAGGAWRALGFTTEEAPEKMESYKTLADARASGWVASPESTPGIVALTPPATQRVEEVSAGDDLPFGS